MVAIADTFLLYVEGVQDLCTQVQWMTVTVPVVLQGGGVLG